MRKFLLLTFVCLAAALSFGVVSAQEATVAPAENVQFTIADIVANKDQYFGHELMTEGVITDLINIRAFVLSDGNGIGSNELLVINNTDREFDLAIKNDQRIRLSGTLYPSFNDGGWDQFVGMNTVNGSSTGTTDATMMPTTEDMSMLTPTPEMMATGDMLETTTPDLMATEDMSMPTLVPDTMTTGTDDMTHMGVDLSQMYIPENLRDHTILVLSSLDTITYIETE